MNRNFFDGLLRKTAVFLLLALLVMAWGAETAVTLSTFSANASLLLLLLVVVGLLLGGTALLTHRRKTSSKQA